MKTTILLRYDSVEFYQGHIRESFLGYTFNMTSHPYSIVVQNCRVSFVKNENVSIYAAVLFLLAS